MRNSLLDLVRRHTEANADVTGLAPTSVPGLAIVRTTSPSGLIHAISRPLVCLVLQGAKQVTMGPQVLAFSAGESMLITADVPTVSQITRASPSSPYLSLVLELDRTIVAELASQMKGKCPAYSAPVQVDPTDAQMTEAALRLMRLAGRPATEPVLLAILLRELHYWLMAGRHGAAIRCLGWPEGKGERVARAVAVLRAEFDQPLPTERLAAVASMSVSSFHRHFMAATSLTPLQFQKQLRLIEARRLMTSEGHSASRAAIMVGYESVTQFTREYGRMFGLPPVRDADLARIEALAVA